MSLRKTLLLLLLPLASEVLLLLFQNQNVRCILRQQFRYGYEARRLCLHPSFLKFSDEKRIDLMYHGVLCRLKLLCVLVDLADRERYGVVNLDNIIVLSFCV
jgi:hypothetical protein